ncbi:MAG: response regulator [Nitriliruptor sp.]
MAGHLSYGVANVYWYLGPEVWGWDLPFPSVADAFYLPGYVLILVGLWRLALLRSSHRSSTSGIEIAVVTLGLGAVAWLFLMAPYAVDDAVPLVTKLVALAYPVFDVAFVSVLAGLLILPGHRSTAFWLLAGGIVATLTVDSIYAFTTLEGTYAHGQPYTTLWLVYFGLLGAAALHPSMRELSEPADDVVVDAAWRAWALPVVLVGIRQAALLREVGDRAAAQAGLVAGRDAAMQASQMKSDFLATMSHEIRTPMNAVIGMSGLMMDTDLDEDQERYASGIRSAGESLMALINDILDFSKIEAGKLELESHDFDLEATVEEVAELFSGSASAKGVQIYSYLHPDVPRSVRADSGRLRQILVNLVSNAVKFTESGQILVRVRDDEDTERPGTLRFEVVDTGVGIAEDERERLFEAFTQADASSSRRHGGTGLGLAICVQLVELMGGELGVDSTPGVGSTFWFTLPVRALEERDGRWLRPLEGVRVLVVDDDATNRDIVERQTAAWGMRPTGVADAATALEELTATCGDDPFVVALLDLQMPGTDGLQLADRITRDERFTDLRIALLSSADATLADRRAAGIREYLRKPVRQSQLYDVMMSLLMPADRTEGDAAEARAPAGRPAVVGTVLLVEDNPANQLVGSRLVERSGHRVDVVSDGAEALEALARRRYDAVLMDCQMPVMDGYEATRRLRTLEAGTDVHTPVIAMTAGVSLADRERCIEAGMDDFIAKPVGPGAVTDALERWVRPTAPPERTSALDGPAQPRTAPAAGRGAGGDEPERPERTLDPERWEVVLDLLGDEPAVVEEFVSAFIADVPARIAELRAAVAAGDVTTARAASHRVRGSAMNVGAERLGELAARIEDRAVQGDLTGAEATAEELDVELAAVAAALRGQGAT